MIAVDSSVWIDFFNNQATVQTEYLARMLPRTRVLVADLVLTEVLQGAKSERLARQLMSQFEPLQKLAVVDEQVAIEAARHYRTLRTIGITIRKTIDTLIATRCIIDRIPLLYSDRDFDPFVAHCGLTPLLGLPSGAH